MTGSLRTATLFSRAVTYDTNAILSYLTQYLSIYRETESRRANRPTPRAVPPSSLPLTFLLAGPPHALMSVTKLNPEHLMLLEQATLKVRPPRLAPPTR
jgi:hypothetical protein